MTEHALGAFGGVKEDLLIGTDGSLTIRRSEDVEPILDANQRLQNAGDGYSPSREWLHVARVPRTLWDQWEAMYGVDLFAKENEQLLDRLLSDPVHRKVRIFMGGI